MKKCNLHIKDGKITTNDGKEMILVYLECLERLQEQIKEANEIISYVSRTSKYGPIYEPCYVYCQKWGVK